MTLTPQEVKQQFLSYLEATECTVIEQSPEHLTVKLSPQADKMLTNRPYYWSFVERTGAPAETLSFTFVFDPAEYDGRLQRQAEAARREQPQSGHGADPLLSRYYGAVPALPVIGPGRVQREDVLYGSRRLAQIWEASREEGHCVYLFEVPDEERRPKTRSTAYEQWLGVCFKAEFSCDLKREELHFLGISLSRKTIVDHFDAQLKGRNLQPRLPEYTHVRPAALTLSAAASLLENYLMDKLSRLDYSWADQARVRLDEELAILDSYYEDLLKETDEEKRTATADQHQSRRSEMMWQYSPKITLTAITCGLFHLSSSGGAPA